MSFGIGGSSSSSTSLSVQQSEGNSTAGASSPITKGNGINASANTGKILGVSSTDKSITATGNVLSAGGSIDNSTKIGNNNVINPDSSALTNAALGSLSSALNTAISNRDVIVGNATTSGQPAVTQIGTQTPTTGLVSSVTSGISGLLNSGTVRVILFIAFPVVATVLWWMFHKKKKA